MAIKIVDTRYGRIEGLPAEDQAVSVFKGIPYAQSPAGENRWRLPQPCEPWTGVLKAYSFAPMSMQPRVKAGGFYAREFYPDLELPRAEGGLFLNVWTPAHAADERLPVAIWIHGGAYVNGYAHKMEYNGTEFAKRGIVFVSVNYRLNVFGFFAHPELTAESEYGGSGNWGFYDQRMAIQWVRDNIAAFGGDPGLITIMGQSAGGGSVLTQCLSPLNRGLFQRAVMQSCAALTDTFNWGAIPLEAAEDIGQRFFEYAGIRSVAEAREWEAGKLMDCWLAFCSGGNMLRAAVRNVDHNIIPACENDILLSGDFPDIDYLVGCNKDEHMGNRVDTFTADELRAQLTDLLGPEQARRFERQIPFEDGPSAADIRNHLWGAFMNAFSDNFCRLLCRQGKRPGYRYWFTRTPPGDDHPGVFHAAEYQMMYKTLRFSWRPYTGADYEFSDRFNLYWANFIKHEDPNGLDRYGRPLPRWDRYTLDRPLSLDLNDPGGMCEPGIPTDRFITEYVRQKYDL